MTLSTLGSSETCSKSVQLSVNVAFVDAGKNVSGLSKPSTASMAAINFG